MTRPGRARLVWTAVALGHLAPVLWLFGECLFRNRVPYFRDITFYYLPNDVFLARWLRSGLWPLWNPEADAGAPFLVAYPVDLFLTWALGARGGLIGGILLHLYLALCGATSLARRLGLGAWAAWLAGALYGLSGFVLSTINLRPLFEASAWAPWVLSAFLSLLAKPSLRAAAALGAVSGLQLATLGVEIAAQTALAGLALVPGRAALREPRRQVCLALAGVLAVLLAAPALLGARALTRDRQRAAGFTREQALGHSASPVVLAEALLPRFFGDVHSSSDAGYWGQPFFPEGYPYLVSLYVGPACLVLALFGRKPRLLGLAVVGVLLSLGANGPLGPLMGALMTSFRGPVKFFFLATLALSLLAAHGLERLAARDRPARTFLLCGAAPLLGALMLVLAPEASLAWLGRLVPEALSPRARPVLLEEWPQYLVTTGALGLGAGLAFSLPLPWRGAAGILVVLDLLVVNGPLNPLTQAQYYELQPRMRAVVERAVAEGAYRWFSYGVGNSPPLPWGRIGPSDVWLFYMDRQSLMPRAPMLDGLESAYDIDRTGWAPRGSTLSVAETSPLRFRQHWSRLRTANVRWVLSFVPLPEDLMALRDKVRFTEIAVPLHLYEMKGALPRAFWVSREAAVEARGVLQATNGESLEPTDAASARVSWERVDPHTMRIGSSGPPGYVVVVEGYDSDWVAEGADGRPVPLLRANDRYWALPVPAGESSFTVSYRPAWRRPAIGLASLGVLLGLGMWSRSRPSP